MVDGRTSLYPAAPNSVARAVSALRRRSASSKSKSLNPEGRPGDDRAMLTILHLFYRGKNFESSCETDKVHSQKQKAPPGVPRRAFGKYIRRRPVLSATKSSAHCAVMVVMMVNGRVDCHFHNFDSIQNGAIRVNPEFRFQRLRRSKGVCRWHSHPSQLADPAHSRGRIRSVCYYRHSGYQDT